MTYTSGNDPLSLWNDEDGFYYDAIQWGFGHSQQLPVRSMVGLMPLYATLVLEPGDIKRFPGFKKRMDWFIENRQDISMRNIANIKGQLRGSRTGTEADNYQRKERETESCSLSPPRRD